MDAPPPAIGTDEHTRLFGLAYRMLGDVDDAQEIVQEAYLRWQQADQSSIAAPAGWFVTVVSRLAIDRLRHAQSERALYQGTWLPEPIGVGTLPTPEYAVEQSSDLSMALLVMLERLAPEERAALLLRDVFDTSYVDIADTLGKQPAAVRQMVHRARERVRRDDARVPVAPDAHEQLVHRFLEVLATDDRDGLLALLAPDVIFMSDGGGKVPAAAHTLEGVARIEQVLLALERKYRGRVEHRPTIVNGQLAFASYDADGRLFYVTAIETDGAKIRGFYRMLNPDKLRYAVSR